MLNPQDILIAIVTLDYATIRTATAEGFDFNQQIPGKRPIVEAAQPAKDPTMLRLLWEAGATPTTPWLEELFTAFERNEESPLLAKREKQVNDEAELKTLTHSLSASTLEFTSGVLTLNGLESSIEIPVKPFLLDGVRVETSIVLEPIDLPSNLEGIENQCFLFPVSPEPGYIDGSVYLRTVHNPVDVTEIQFGSLSSNHDHITATIHFNFLLEAVDLPNESIIQDIELEIR